jgi:ribonuclease HI
MPWGFFDDACQGPEKKCGIGFSLYLSSTHYIHGKSNIGTSSNNIVEFSTLLALLKLATFKGIHNFHIYGDSKLCIGWMKNVIHLQHMNLIQLGQKLHYTAKSFEDLIFTHIYKELNIEVDTLSKEVLQLPSNALVWEEFLEGSSIAHEEDTFY